jgi:WhiB family transcriptional regulator, redox-sensing transcriptional regulator
MTTKTESRNWWPLAACQAVSTELFFPVTEAGPGRLQVARAKAICTSCRVRRECLDYAMSTHQAHGVWGGLSESERRSLRAEPTSTQLDRVS